MPSTGFNFSCLTVLLNTSPRRKMFCSFMCVQNIASGTALLWDCDFAWTYNWLQLNVHDSGTASFLSWSTCRSWNVNILHTLSPEQWNLTCPRSCISATVATMSWAARPDVTTDSQHQVEARAQVSGRKLIPCKGKPKSSEHYFTH